MNEGIRLLQAEFIGKGEVKTFQFRQLMRGQPTCVYEVSDYGLINNEVFRIRVGKLPGTDTQYESYPKANSFGIWAWTYRNYEKAIGKFNEIENYEQR